MNEESNTENICPKCNEYFDSLNKRLIVEICGHKKCRTCLINEENGCEECNLTKLNDNELSNIDTNVYNIVRYENELPKLNRVPYEKSEYQSINQTNSIGSSQSDDGLCIDTDNDGDENNDDTKSILSNCSKKLKSHENDLIENFNNNDNGDSELVNKTIDYYDGQDSKTPPPVKKVKKRKKPRVSYPAHLIETKLNGISVFKCTICNKEFKSLNNRRYHFYCDESLKKPYKCDKCDKSFITQSHLDYHLNTHQPSNNFECNVCSRIFLRMQSLRKHMKKHEGKFNHICNKCGKKFLYKEQAILHEHRHNNTSQFHCTFNSCKKQFTTKSNLRKHLEIHSGNKYMCDLCKREFNQRSSLKNHMHTHSNKNKFECNECFKLFLCQKTLDRHMKIHTNKSYFQCPMCPIQSTRRDNIRRHIRNLHTDGNMKELFHQIKSTKNSKINDIDKNDNEAKISNPLETIDEQSNKLAQLPTPLNSCSVIKFVGRSMNYPSCENSSIKPLANIISNEIITAPNCQPLEINLNESAELEKDLHKNVQISRQLLSPYLKPPKEVIENSNANTKQINSSLSSSSSSSTLSSFTDDLPMIPRLIENRRNQPIRKRYDNLEIYRQILMPHRNINDDQEKLKTTKSNTEIITNNNVYNQKEMEPNRNQSNFTEIHWRKRTSQCFNQMKMDFIQY